MNKALPISASVIVLGALIAPKIIGTQMEDKLAESIQAINAMPGYSIELIEQDAGWFSSNTKLAFSYDTTAGIQDLPGEKLTTELNLDASYGPILFGNGAALGLVDWKLAVLANELRDVLLWPEADAFYQIKGVSDFFLNGKYQDAVTPFTSLAESETQVDFSGYQGAGSYDGETFSYLGDAKSFNASNGDDEFDANALTIQMDIEGALEDVFSSGFYDSQSKFAIAKMHYQSDSTDEVLDILNSYVTSTSKIDESTDSMGIDMVYGIDSITLDDFVGTDFALGLELNNLSKVFFSQYQEFLTGSSAFDTDASTEDMLAYLNDALLPLVVAEPELNITRLGGTIPEGSFESHLNSSLVGITALPQTLDDVGFWLSHTLMDGQIKGDKAVIELAAKQFMLMQLKTNPQTQGMSALQLEQIADSQVPILLQTISAQGLIEANDEGYSTRLSLKDSVFKVNGMEMPLPF